jgi:hypothetical protein
MKKRECLNHRGHWGQGGREYLKPQRGYRGQGRREYLNHRGHRDHRGRGKKEERIFYFRVFRVPPIVSSIFLSVLCGYSSPVFPLCPLWLFLFLFSSSVFPLWLFLLIRP